MLAAWALSFAALGRRRVHFEHLIWMLLPIDMYGVQLAGFTLKPYMLFSAVLFLRMLMQRRLVVVFRSRWSLVSGASILLFMIVNMFNNESYSSPLSSAMLAVVWCCCMIYMNCCGEDSSSDISEVMLATGIGYGIVFILVYLLLMSGASFPGLVAQTREETGIFMQFSETHFINRVNIIRLRGFTIDPNSMIGTFLFSAIVANYRIVFGRGGFREWAAVLISSLCIWYSGSRMGIVCLYGMLIMSNITGYCMADVRSKNRLKILLIVLFASMMLFAFTDLIANTVQGIRTSIENRPFLTGSYGRLSLWKNALDVLFKKGALWGIGMGNTQLYTPNSLACHNSWLEFICAGGILVGGFMVLHLAGMLLSGLRHALRLPRVPSSAFAWTMVLGTLGIVISLLSVDNVTYSYLWFGASVITAITDGQWEEST